MFKLDAPIKYEEIKKIRWEEHLIEARSMECEAFSEVLLRKSIETQNTTEKEGLLLLGFICALRSDTDSAEEPIKDGFLSYHGQSAELDRIPDHYYNLLKELIKDDIDCEIQARICDILWVKKRDYQAAQQGIVSYLDSFQRLMDFEHWPPCVDRMNRAIQIATSIGRKNQLYEVVIKKIEDALDEADGKDMLFFSARLMELLQGQKAGNAQKYAVISEKMALGFEQMQKWQLARAYWKISARWEVLLNEKEAEKSKQISYTETYVKQAEKILHSNSEIRFSTAVGLIQSAIAALRNVQGTKERVTELHQLLLQYQKHSVKEMIPTTIGPIDVSNIQVEVIEKVENQSFEDAVFILANLASTADVERLRQTIKKNNQKFFFRQLFSAVAVNEAGKVTERRPSNLFKDSEQEEAIEKSEMYQHATYQHFVSVFGMIEPARKQILLEHPVRMKDLQFIIEDNPFIDPSRMYIYARGLHAGFHGDFAISTHLLIPQFENSIRMLLEHHGIIVSNLDTEGVQDEKSLNSLLCMPELERIIGKNLVFDLQGLFIERFGSNLRNRFAHGLISDNGFESYQVVYAWWIILKICCLFKLSLIESN